MKEFPLLNFKSMGGFFFIFKSESDRDFFSLIFVADVVAVMETVNWIPYKPNGSDVAFALAPI